MVLPTGAASVRPGASMSAHRSLSGPQEDWDLLSFQAVSDSSQIVFTVQEGGPSGPWGPEQECVCTQRFLSSLQDAAAWQGEGGKEDPRGGWTGPRQQVLSWPGHTASTGRKPQLTTHRESLMREAAAK